MKSRAAIAQYEATIVLVVISLSLASIVYTGLRRESNLDPEPLFVNEETPIGGSPAIERLEVNSSSATTDLLAQPRRGELHRGRPGLRRLRVLDDQVPLRGRGDDLLLGPGVPGGHAGGRHQRRVLGLGNLGRSGERLVWLAGGDDTGRDLLHASRSRAGQAVPAQWSPSSSLVSSIPVEGALTGTAFTFYVPSGGGSHSLLITSSGGSRRRLALREGGRGVSEVVSSLAVLMIDHRAPRGDRRRRAGLGPPLGEPALFQLGRGPPGRTGCCWRWSLSSRIRAAPDAWASNSSRHG